MNIPTRTRTAATAALLIALAGGALTGCTATGAGTEAGTEAAPEVSTAEASDSLTITDAWVKTADDGMTAAFGVLENTGKTDIVVTGAASAAAAMIELHETVMGDDGSVVMQPREGGFTVPAGGTFELAPAGNHIMLMGLTAPILAGSEVSFELTLTDGSVFTFTAPAKDYSGANEEYVGDGDMEMND